MSTYNANGREEWMRKEWLRNSFRWKETGVTHFKNSFQFILLPSVSFVLLCLFALRFVAGSYKTGLTPIADFKLNKSGYSCLCLVNRSCIAVIKSAIGIFLVQVLFLFPCCRSRCIKLYYTLEYVNSTDFRGICFKEIKPWTRDTFIGFFTSACLITALQTKHDLAQSENKNGTQKQAASYISAAKLKAQLVLLECVGDMSWHVIRQITWSNQSNSPGPTAYLRHANFEGW